ncbi:bactofilin family protein [Evansella cellulosilytica]|uniref:Polymer-forming cytoskeletal protein n=1 Tax=Evansella cellulosilytica (strain ATCC 21833 / DSM 2522 / FERM P-1141 / JCM 9156 / N-4) TaxID=649639 RepID=E6U106_EVAC2|nr:polymer-forming cytoskeletal protein [Evansella cellulosilytica]ADU30318.1 protein of unknown function DUF583 [Evansella cellulosilytica DSM 2522]
MFAKQKEDKKLNEITTIIGEETTIEGKLNVEASIRIDGKVLGEVYCLGDVTVGKNGYIEKKLEARNLFIAGKVKGTVKVENKVHIYETGNFDGSCEMKTIVIDEKGQFTGSSMMHNDSNENYDNVVGMEEKSEEA